MRPRAARRLLMSQTYRALQVALGTLSACFCTVERQATRRRARGIWEWKPGEIKGDSRGIRGGFEGDSRGIRGDSDFGRPFSPRAFIAAGGIQTREVFTIKILIRENEATGRRRGGNGQSLPVLAAGAL